MERGGKLLAYLEIRTRCAWLLVGKERKQLQRLFLLPVLKQVGGALVAQAPTPFLRGVGQLSWRLAATALLVPLHHCAAFESRHHFSSTRRF